jgi:predicted amidohydrolase YtcJ
MHEPYVGGGYGCLIYSDEELALRMRTAEKAGYSVAVHSIGDRSTDVVLDILESMQKPNAHRIEHAMLLSDEQVNRLAKASVRVVMQPEFTKRFGHAYKRQLGERAEQLNPVGRLLRRGAKVAFSSDRPIVPGNPWDGIIEASSRDDALTVEQAVRLYTQSAADAMGDGSDFGSLDVGQAADFQLYERNPMSGEELPFATYISGEAT